MIRRLAAILAATAMLLVLAVPVLAGGWADIVADGQTTTPKEGGSVEIGFRVMQHGVTPAPWETATVHFLNSSTGTTFDVVAKNDDPNGHFVATATIPEAGFWSWQVTLANLESSQVPVRMTVLSKSGAAPAVDPSTLLAAVDRAKDDAIRTVTDQVYVDIGRLETENEAYGSRIDTLNAQVGGLTEERDSLATRVSALEGAGGLPLLALISLALLAGGAAGFTMAWLAGRSPRNDGSAVALTPTPRGADPV
jgi:hypothetical protein